MFQKTRKNKTAKKNLYLNEREKNWNDRFFLEKIPQFDAYKDINYLSLGLLKSKLRYDEKSKKKNLYKFDSQKGTKSNSTKRIFSATVRKPKNFFIRKTSANSRYTKNKEFDNNFNNYDRNFNFYSNYNNSNKYNNYNNFDDLSFEEDPELSKLYQSLKSLWRKLGVTDAYIKNVEFMLSYKFTTREEIEKIIITQKTQMKQFKADIMKIVEEITKREKYINDIKKYDRMYEQLKYNSTNENNYELPETVQEVNQNLLEKDIYECLKCIRLSSINVVYLFKKFKSNYYYLINGKLDTDFLKEFYSFDMDYLSKLKHDTDFLKDTSLNEIYEFSREGSDPFLLSISEKLNDVLISEDFNYKILPTSEELLTVAKNLMSFLDEEEILDMLNNGQNTNTLMDENFPIKNNFLYSNEQNLRMRKDSLYEIGKNFKGDMNREVEKLIKRKEYNNLFFNTESGIPVSFYNFNLCKNMNISKKPNKPTRSMTHEEIIKTFKKYSDLKNSLKLNKEKLRLKGFNSKNKYN